MPSESCLTIATITFDMDHTNKPRALPEGAFCGAGIEQLCLPCDFHNIGPRACENCKSLVEVNLMSTEITALLSSTFAHCVALNWIWLPLAAYDPGHGLHPWFRIEEHPSIHNCHGPAINFSESGCEP